MRSLPFLFCSVLAVSRHTVECFSSPLFLSKPRSRTHQPSRIRHLPPSVQPADGVHTLSAAQTGSEVESSPSPKWVTPAVHNKMGVRVLTILSALVLIGGKDLFKVGTTSIFTHLLGVSLYLGVNFYTTFVLGITLFKNLPVQMFGRLQSKLFPMYFQLLSGCLVVLLSSRKAVGLPAGILSDVSSRNLLIVSLVCTLLNLFYLEPATTTNMFRRYEIENMKDATDRSANAGEYKKLRKSFAFLHGMSSFVNLLALVAGTVYAWDLSTSIAKVIEAAAVGSAVASEAGVSAAVAVMS